MHIFRKTTLFMCYPLANFILAQRYVVLETFTTLLPFSFVVDFILL